MRWIKHIGFLASVVWLPFVWLVDQAIKYYLRVTSPKYAVALFIVSNVAIAIVALLVTESRNDFLTLSGYGLTFTGFLIAIGELYRARTTADEIQDAMRREAQSQRQRLYRLVLDRALASLTEAETRVSNYEWSLAIMRLRDLMESLAYVNSISPAADDRWSAINDSVQGWVVIFDAGQNGKKLSYNRSEWHELTFTVKRHLDSELAPFRFGEGGQR